MRDDDLNSRQRVWFLDEARGLSILLMVLHHGAYDAAFLLGWPLDFLSAGWFGIIRTFFVGGFVHQLEGCAGVHQLDGIAGAHGAFYRRQGCPPSPLF